MSSIRCRCHDRGLDCLVAAPWRRSGLALIVWLGCCSGRRPRAVEPIRCWRQSSAGAVTVGEAFTVTLTCAVFESADAQVVPDESRLDVASIQMAPFEILGGAHPPDVRRGSRRFFQYRYQLRIIGRGRHRPGRQRAAAGRFPIACTAASARPRSSKAATCPTCCRRCRSGCCRSFRRMPPTFATRPRPALRRWTPGVPRSRPVRAAGARAWRPRRRDAGARAGAAGAAGAIDDERRSRS